MKKLVKAIVILGIISIAVFWASDRFALFQSPIAPGESFGTPTNFAATTTPLISTPYVIETVASGLDTPWSIVFTSADRMLVTERPGRLRVIERGTLLAKPLHTFSGISEISEEGLMSLALHPDYRSNRQLYVSYAYAAADGLWVKVVRFRDNGDRLNDELTILDRIPAAKYHAGNRLAFGPDRKLYITTGDSTHKELAQQMDSLAGKILRLNPDGSIPDDNPFPNSPVYSFGHRNPQGISWHPVTGELYSTEHGPSVIDGPAGGDEINRIVKGGNYGWPLVSHGARREGTVAPLWVFTPAEAPASALVYSGQALPQFRNDLFFGALRGEGLVRVRVSPQDPDLIMSVEKLAQVQLGRIREVAEGPGGAIYFSTSNRDGRGNPSAEDDRIMRIIPKP